MVDFKYFLNRQGPRGQQGVKGEQGYSPQITVGKNTASEFTLKIINEDGSFETENLKVVPEDRGGTYVRYDRNTYQEYIGDPDFASTEKYGVVRLATKEDLATQEESLAVSSAILNTYLQENYLNKVHGDVVTGDVSFRGHVGFVDAPSIDKIKDENYNQYLTRNVSDYTTKIGSLTIPDDNSRLKQGTKEVAYTSDLAEFVTNTVLNNTISNLVTLDTAQTITGKKNFTNAITLNSVIRFNTSTALIKGGKSSLDVIFGAYDDRIMVGNQNTRTIQLNSNTITDYNGNNLLSSANVEAGNNVTIEKTSAGIKISSTGGGSGTGDVTLAGDNSFTGNNTFDGETTFNARTRTIEQEAVTLNVTSNATLKNASVTGTLSSLGEISAVSIQAAGIKNNQNNKYYLNQASITAGSDNLVIAETETGIKLVVNAPTNAQIEALQTLINDLSTKIDNLTNRVKALEETIDGGIA
nr:MAG TPA: Lower baseplate protein N-terminal domain [Caudoviricetes sp.]